MLRKTFRYANEDTLDAADRTMMHDVRSAFPDGQGLQAQTSDCNGMYDNITTRRPIPLLQEHAHAYVDVHERGCRRLRGPAEKHRRGYEGAKETSVCP